MRPDRFCFWCPHYLLQSPICSRLYISDTDDQGFTYNYVDMIVWVVVRLKMSTTLLRRSRKPLSYKTFDVHWSSLFTQTFSGGDDLVTRDAANDHRWKVRGHCETSENYLAFRTFRVIVLFLWPVEYVVVVLELVGAPASEVCPKWALSYWDSAATWYGVTPELPGPWRWPHSKLSYDA